RYLLYERGRRSLPSSPPEGGDASPAVGPLRARRLSRRDRRQDERVLSRAEMIEIGGRPSRAAGGLGAPPPRLGIVVPKLAVPRSTRGTRWKIEKAGGDVQATT